jgi:hypothetical protein
MESMEPTSRITAQASVAPSLVTRLQRDVLLELLREGDDGVDVAELAGRLRADLDSVWVAGAALEAAGLVQVAGDAVAAAPPARYFDALWPVAV